MKHFGSDSKIQLIFDLKSKLFGNKLFSKLTAKLGTSKMELNKRNDPFRLLYLFMLLMMAPKLPQV